MSDGVFDNLTVNLLSKLIGNVDIYGNVRMNSKSIFLKGDLNHGLEYQPDRDGPVLFGLGGGALGYARGDGTIGDVLTWDRNGNVGIGTTKPLAKLYITGGDLLVNSSTGSIDIKFGGTDNGWSFATTGGGSTLLLMESPSKGSETSRVAFDAGGNVGIGTENPSEKLTIQGDASAPYALNVGGTSNARIKVRHLDGKDYRSGNLDNLYLQYGVKNHTILNAGGSNGNVGIGTEEPKTKLDVIGNRIRLRSSTNPGTKEIVLRTDGAAVDLDANNTNLFIKSTTGNTIIQGFGGNVGIGTANPATTLDVNGNINVAGDISLSGADCAEEFDVAEIEKIDSGTVLVIGDESKLQPCKEPYDKKVAGVVSGGSGTNPGIILGKNATQNKRLPIALNGKVYCKVDAQYSPIEVGDLLTTSHTDGHAMKADDPLKSFGAVIGKAICPLREGTGLIPILVALQ